MCIRCTLKKEKWLIASAQIHAVFFEIVDRIWIKINEEIKADTKILMLYNSLDFIMTKSVDDIKNSDKRIHLKIVCFKTNMA